MKTARHGEILTLEVKSDNGPSWRRGQWKLEFIRALLLIFIL